MLGTDRTIKKYLNLWNQSFSMIDKKTVIVLLIILAVISSVIILYSGDLLSIITDGKFISTGKAFCRETDDGLDYYNKGATYGKSSNGEIYDNFDFCEDSEILYEWYCRGSGVSFERHKCPKGCTSGICAS